MDKSRNMNTTKATSTRMNVYHTWAKHRREVLVIEKVEPKKLDKILQHFFTELKKQDRQDYEPNSLCATQASIGRYFCERGYTHLMFIVLEGKAQVIREDGSSNKSSSLKTREINPKKMKNSPYCTRHREITSANSYFFIFRDLEGINSLLFVNARAVKTNFQSLKINYN